MNQATKNNATMDQTSKRLFKLGLFFFFVFFESFGWMGYTIATLSGKDMFDDPRIELEMYVQTGLCALSLGALAGINFFRFIRWMSHGNSN